MGLDMYLTASHFIWSTEEKQLEGVKGLNIPGTEGFRPRHIEYDAIYWRKANHIHAWFVENVQGGKDDCANYDVSREQLAALRDACLAVLADHSKAADLLPTQPGFFFGSTEYDEYYFGDCQRTADEINKILSNPETEHLDFMYHSSW